MTAIAPMVATPPRPPRPRRWAGLAVLCASLLLVMMDMTILNVALPAISADLRPDSVQLLWIVDAYALVLSGLLITASSLGDRWGRRRLAAQVQDAFTRSLEWFGVAGAGLMLATAIAVWWLTPGDLDVSAGHRSEENDRGERRHGQVKNT